MKLGELLSVTENKTNKQVTASFKKKKLKELDLDVKDLLDLTVSKKKW